ncbi:MAG: phosphohydrolase [Spirochaetes bacterium]|nr:phosphohydrolase [Spirochaetota bacterium]
MDRTICPGQDTRYWRPGDIFNVPCGSCGASIEFFKDDAVRRCSRCGARVRNPRLSTGCAQWCRHAKECLGYDPSGAAAGGGAPATRLSIERAIIDAIKKEFGDTGEATARALAALDRARPLMMGTAAKPGVVIPAVLLIPAFKNCDGAHSTPVESIMKEAGVERCDFEDACAIIHAHHAGTFIDTPEFRIVAESYAGD